MIQLCALVMQHFQTVKIEDLKELLSYFYTGTISMPHWKDIKKIETSC